MKKLLILMIAAAAIAFAACSKDHYPQDSDTPPHAASTKTWVIESADGSIKQTWSDAIQIPECKGNEIDKWAAAQTPGVPRCGSRILVPPYVYEDTPWFVYNWPYVDQYADRLCPSPWRVPSAADFVALDLAFGGDGTRRSDLHYVLDNYVRRWDDNRPPECPFESCSGTGNGPTYWSSTAAICHASTDTHSYPCAVALHWSYGGYVYPNWDYDRYAGWSVRCVK